MTDPHDWRATPSPARWDATPTDPTGSRSSSSATCGQPARRERARRYRGLTGIFDGRPSTTLRARASADSGHGAGPRHPATSRGRRSYQDGAQPPEPLTSRSAATGTRTRYGGSPTSSHGPHRSRRDAPRPRHRPPTRRSWVVGDTRATSRGPARAVSGAISDVRGEPARDTTVDQLRDGRRRPRSSRQFAGGALPRPSGLDGWGPTPEVGVVRRQFRGRTPTIRATTASRRPCCAHTRRDARDAVGDPCHPIRCGTAPGARGRCAPDAPRR
jgi:hypothetical protein